MLEPEAQLETVDVGEDEGDGFRLGLGVGVVGADCRVVVPAVAVTPAVPVGRGVEVWSVGCVFDRGPLVGRAVRHVGVLLVGVAGVGVAS